MVSLEKVTLEDIENFQAEKGDKWDWVPAGTGHDSRTIRKSSNIAGELKSYLATIKDNPLMLRCLGCRSNFLMKGCRKCESDMLQFEVEGEWEQTIDIVLFCCECGETSSSWSCPNCGNMNPYRKTGLNHPQPIHTVYWLEKKGCFIATAVYGSSNYPEVILLRSFRDDILLKSWFGILFVKFYYKISPKCAHSISRRKYLRLFIRKLLLNPIVESIKGIKPQGKPRTRFYSVTRRKRWG